MARRALARVPQAETAQTRLRRAARAAGWQAEYEVRGYEWIADVLCTNGRTFFALEDQLVDNRTLEDRTRKYHRSGVYVAWFTPHLQQRTIKRLIGTVPIFDEAAIERAVPELLAAAAQHPLPRMVAGDRMCELCGAPISTVATFWCWSCWMRFEAPNSTTLARPHVHLSDWTRAKEQAVTRALDDFFTCRCARPDGGR